ncbi:hypothetical protein PMI14_06901 [Acidovorax sp. CF316]|uniref:hypothetical protein n=1 Tax=Acidovorax sp. CF316 TaxID=1144317 RepID=UPI00026BEAC3|nr:hypothetical protein [Acidovorax sp. CF316]EJE48635.1 hypothetical protein PMI14_06901 [Acidovorax sp. CF316]
MGKKVVALAMAWTLAVAAGGVFASDRQVEAVSGLVKGASSRLAAGVEQLAQFQGVADQGLFKAADDAALVLDDTRAAVQRIDTSARPAVASAALAYLKAAQGLVKGLQDARRKAALADVLDREGAQAVVDLKEARESDRPPILERMEKLFGQSDEAEAAMKASVGRASEALAELELRRSLLAAQLGSADALLPEKTLAAVKRGLQAVQPQPE